MKTLILHIGFGGLGDHLFYSHIPRIAKETGSFDKVFISNRSPFRSPDYRRLVWKANPYLDGFSDEEPTVQTKSLSDFSKSSREYNILDSIMLCYGLDDGMRWHEPELYYTPHFIESLAGASIYDPNYVSNVGNVRPKDVRRTVRREGFKIGFQMYARNKSIPLPDADLARLSASSLEGFCDIIYSCERLYCLTSGTATLAAALGKPVVAFYGSGQSERFHHSKLHRYVRVRQQGPIARTKKAARDLAARLYKKIR